MQRAGGRFCSAVWNEAGLALPTVMMLVLILFVLALGISNLVMGNVLQGGVTKEHTKALHVAEAGIDDAVWQLEKKGELPAEAYTHAVGEGTATVTGSQIGNNIWQIRSRALTLNGGKAGVQVTALSYSIWDSAFSKGLRIKKKQGKGSKKGLKLGQQSSKFVAYGTFYFAGDITLRNASQIFEGPLFIKGGNLAFEGTGCQVGSVDAPIVAFIDGTYPSPAQGFYYSSVSPDVPDIQLPSLEEMQTIRDQADLVIDKDSVTNRNYNVNITQNQSFSRSSATGKFIWDKGAQTLTIQGLVFIDGKLALGESGDRPSQITYLGRGTIVTNGNIEVNTKVLPSGGLSSSNIMTLISPKKVVLRIKGREYDTGYTPPTRTNLSYTKNIDIAAVLFGQTSIEFRSIDDKKVTNPKTTLVGSLITSTLDFGKTKKPIYYYIFVDRNTSSYLDMTQLDKVFVESFPNSTFLLTDWHEIAY